MTNRNHYRLEYRLKYARKSTVIDSIASHHIHDLGRTIMISRPDKNIILPRCKLMLYSLSLITT
jgi:hypothetical protein